MTITTKVRLPRLTKFLYSISDFTFSFTDTTMSVLWAIFMSDVVGLKLSYAALVILIGRVWDAILSSPRLRAKWDWSRSSFKESAPSSILCKLPDSS